MAEYSPYSCLIPPLVTKSGPNKGGGLDKMGSKFSDLEITHIFWYLPQKNVLFWRDWIPNSPMTRSDNFFRYFEVPFRTHPKRCRFSAATKKGGGAT